MVRITGERPLQGNKWSRFNQTYPVPENSEAETLQGTFEFGTLVVTMPKKFVSPVEPEVKTTQERGPRPSEKAAAEGKPEKEPLIGDKKSGSLPSPVKGPSDFKAEKATQEGTSSQRSSESRKPEEEKGLKASIPSEPIRGRSPQKGQELTVKRPAVTGKPQKAQEESEPKPNLTDEKPPKRREEVEPKPTSTAVTRDPAEEKRQEEIRLKARLEALKKQLDEKTPGTRAEDAEKERVSKKEVKEEDGKPSEPRKPVNDVEKGVFKEKEIRTRRVSPKVAEASTPKLVPEKDKESSNLANGIRELAASASHVVTRIAEGKWNDEEKHLVVNMGAAVLVIAALGVYVSYRFASS